jgi:hypothetical protein
LPTVDIGRISVGLGQGGVLNAGLEQDVSEIGQVGKPAEPLKLDTNILATEIERVARGIHQDVIARVRLSLHPPELGHLVVDFKHDENGLRVEFYTQNPTVQKALENLGPKMMERMEEAGVDVGSLDVFLNNGNAEDQRTFSPLDDPSRPPTLVGFGDEVMSGQEGGTIDTPPMMYLAYDGAAVDLLI